MKKEKSIKFQIWIPIFLGILLLLSGYHLVSSYMLSKETIAEYKNLASEVLPEKENTNESVPIPELSIDWDQLKKINPECVGWIYIPSLKISYPLVQGTDNTYYLKHTFFGKEGKEGGIFMDYLASTDWSDRNTFIFGHNMHNGSMFGSLKKYINNPEIEKEDPYFYIYKEDEVVQYEIFSYYLVSASSDRYLEFTTDADYDNYVNWAMKYSVYKEAKDMSKRKPIVTLSTCYGASGNETRMLVHGVLNQTKKQ